MSNRNIPKHYKSSSAQVRNFTGQDFQDIQVEPYNGSSFNNATRKIQFRLPRSGILDGQKSFLKADVLVAGGSADHLASIFNKMKVYCGNVLLQDSTDFGNYRTKE